MDKPCVSLWQHDAAMLLSDAADVAHQLQSQIAILDGLIAEGDRQIVHLRQQLTGKERDHACLPFASAARRPDLLVAPLRTQRKAA